MASLKAFLNAIPHWAYVVLFAGLGAAWTFLQQAGPVTLFDAVQHWATLKPMLEGAASAGAMTMLALLRKEPWAAAASAFLAFVGTVAILGACGIFSPAAVVQPVANLAACIAEKAIAKESVAQIAIDCESTALVVIADLLGSKNSEVSASPAAAESRTLAAVMGSSAGK